MGWIAVVFLALPLIEIGLLVTLGAWFGLWLTLAIVVGTGALGVGLMRSLGGTGRSLASVRGDLLSPLAERALLGVAAGLLILPGFLTDMLGLILLVPMMRRWAVVGLAARFGRPGGGRRPDDEVIDGEFFEIPPEATPLRRPSDWTRH